MSERSQFVCDIFSEVAPKYDAFNNYSSFGRYRYWLKVLAKRVARRPHRRMLDIAAGTGDVSFSVAQVCPLESITLTDFCEEMLDVARQRRDRGENNGIPMTFQVEDAHELPFEDESFDLVTVAYGIRNFDDRLVAMSEAYRVLEKGGEYVIMEFGTPPNALWRALYHFYLRTMIPLIGKAVAHKIEGFTYFRDSILHFPPQDVIVKELKSLGFTDVNYVNLTGGIISIYSATK